MNLINFWKKEKLILRAIFCKNQAAWNSDFFKNPSFLHILFLLWSIWIPEFFFKFWWLVLKLWLIKVRGIFSKNWFLAGRATLTQIIFRSQQHRHISFPPKYWYIMEIHHKKWKTSMCTRSLLTLATPKKMQILKIDSSLTVSI